MFACTSVSVPLSPWVVRQKPVIKGIFATVRNPAGERVQVLVEDIRLVNLLSQNGEPPYKVASVSVSPQCLPFDVRLPELHNITAFVEVER